MYWWICPKCQSDVDFTQQLNYVFEEDGEASFEVKRFGLLYHTIECENEKCNANWVLSISPIHEDSY